eukprot:TRINITY_DN7413_c0_g1_i12.p1 TRINITY_DN7413_c0_g1~~TRINITY_DN7413_c0_g1_i12.p1  ORF type:complete len:603 (+),score=24.17 TRINITY_DN7413_c0_g1_i12:65-1873(+)
MGGVKNRNTQRGFRELKRELRAQNNSHTIASDSKVKKCMNEDGENGWSPSAFTAWKLILSIRIGSAVWSGISDCDETYNYWEPTHHLIYGQGLQTWEYDPKYALRSYLYLLVHALPGWLYTKLVSENPLQVFYLTRFLLACICSSCETYFYLGVVEEFGVNVGRLTYALLTLSAGMFISSTAYLPSSTSMYLVCLAYGAWFSKNYKLAIFASALSTLSSWPFTCILAAPIALDILRRSKHKMFITWSGLSALAILPPMIVCDSFYYGRTVLPTLNIVLYNVFTSHGPDLYGTEPWTYYLYNGVLNFNIMFPAALIAVPVVYLTSLALGVQRVPCSGKRLPLLISQLGMYLWLIVFWLQPHKEERFLFPIYPLLLLAAALLIDTVQRLIHLLLRVSSTTTQHVSKMRGYSASTSWFVVFTLTIFGLLSASRIVGLYQHYQGSMSTWLEVSQLGPSHHTSNICLGKEWHRFPSSFFLPSTSYKIGFLASDFRGQLPKYYAEMSNSTIPTAIYHKDFNDQNLEEPSRYIDLEQCHYIVDLDCDWCVTSRQPRYSLEPGWSTLSTQSYLDSRSSHPVFRAFFFPFLDSKYCKYSKYLLLKKSQNGL